MVIAPFSPMVPLTRTNGEFPAERINANLFIQDFNTVTIYEADSKGGAIESAPVILPSC
jgi:hypothetical protein